MAFDDIYEHLSGAGWYQLSLYMLLGIPSFHGGVQSIIMNFLGPDQDHWCYVDKLTCLPNDQQQYIAAPYDEDGNYDRCNYYDLPYENYTYDELRNWNRSMVPDNTPIIPCDNGWYYDQTEFYRTIVSDYELVCDRYVLVPLSYSFVIAARLLLMIFASIFADKLGRKPLLLVGALTHLIFVFGSAYAQTYAMYVVMRSLLYCSVALTYEIGFVIPIEIFSPDKRSFPGGFYWCFWAIGYMSVSAMAYFVRDSVNLQLVAGVPLLLHISFIWLVPESPRWYQTVGKTDKCEETVRFMAEVNQDDIPQKTYDNLHKVENKNEASEESFWSLVKMAFCNRTLLKRFFLTLPAWAGSYIVYYGLSFNTGALAGNFYLNTALSGFVEIPANLLVLYLLRTPGRKYTQSLSLIFAGIANLLCIPLIDADESLTWLIVLFNLLAKGCITVSFTTICVYALELFPTSVRALMYNLSSFLGGLTALLAPFMGIPLIRIWPPLPLILFGCIGIGAGACVLLLPDTTHEDLPDSIIEAVQIGTIKEPKMAQNIDNEAGLGTDKNLDQNPEITGGSSASVKMAADSNDNNKVRHRGHNKVGVANEGFVEGNQGDKSENIELQKTETDDLS